MKLTLTTFWRRFVCAALGHTGPLRGGPFAQLLDCERCERTFRIGVD